MDKEYTKTSLVRSVRARIVRELRNGRYRLDQPLPTQRAWAKRFGVSTITVFRALDVLKAEGFVDSSKGASTFLRAIPPPALLRQNDPQAVKPVCITAWVYDRKDLTKINFAIARQRFQALFRREHPAIEFREKQVEVSADEFQALLISSILRGAEPTFALTTQTCLPFLRACGAIRPLADCGVQNAELDEYLAEMNPMFVKAGGRVQGSEALHRPASISHSSLMLPTGVSYSFLFYNKTLFSKAGLNPDQPPRDWAEFTACAKKLSQSAGGKPGFHIIGSKSLMWWLEQLVYQTSENSTNETLPGIDWLGKEAATAVEWLLDFHFAQQLLYVHTGNLAHVLPACLANEIPMMMDSSGLAVKVAELGEAGRFGIAPMPVGPNGRAISQMNCGGCFINAHAVPPEQEAALRYLLAWEQWVHLGAGGRQLRALGVAPPLFSLMRAPAQDQFLIKDMPSDWQDALTRIKAHGFWERPGADWTRMAMGDTLADWLSHGEPLGPERILQQLRLSEHKAITLKKGSNTELKTEDESFRMRGLECALSPGKG